MSLRLLLLAGWCWLVAAGPPAAAEPPNPHLYASLRWRMIGPFRGGRTVGAGGVARPPEGFFLGVHNGCVLGDTRAPPPPATSFGRPTDRLRRHRRRRPVRPRRPLRRQRRGPAAARPLHRRRRL